MLFRVVSLLEIPLLYLLHCDSTFFTNFLSRFCAGLKSPRTHSQVIDCISRGWIPN